MSQKYSAAEECEIPVDQLEDLGDYALGLKLLVKSCEATYIGVCHCICHEARKMMLEQVTVAHSGMRLVGLVGIFLMDVQSLKVIGVDAQARKRLWKEFRGEDKRKSTSLMSQVLPPPSFIDVEGTDDDDESQLHLDSLALNGESALLPNFTRTIFRPAKWLVISKFGDDFQHCLLDLQNSSIVSVFMCGVNLGRNGTLAWLCLGTVNCVYVIDAASVGVDALLKSDIGAVLQDKNKVKVIHDGRKVHDYLYHQYQFRIINVFDTQASDIYLHALCHGNKPPLLVKSLSCLVHQYLNIQESSLANVFLEIEDESMWLERPLPEALVLFLVHSVMFLLQLREVMVDMILTDLNRVNKTFIESLQAKPSSIVSHVEKQLVPPEVQKMFKRSTFGLGLK